MHYTVIQSPSIEGLISEVNDLIKNDGYEPLGGICAFRVNETTVYCQALIGEKEIKKVYIT